MASSAVQPKTLPPKASGPTWSPRVAEPARYHGVPSRPSLASASVKDVGRCAKVNRAWLVSRDAGRSAAVELPVALCRFGASLRRNKRAERRHSQVPIGVLSHDLDRYVGVSVQTGQLELPRAAR